MQKGLIDNCEIRVDERVLVSGPFMAVRKQMNMMNHVGAHHHMLSLEAMLVMSA